MATVLTLDKEKKEFGAEKKVEGFMMRHRKGIIVVAAVVLAAALGTSIVVGVMEHQRKKGIAEVYAIETTYRKNFVSLNDEEIVTRQNEALASLENYTSKTGIIGVRANMLAADIYFAKKDFTKSMDCWQAAADADKKAYTVAICNYNIGVCLDELGNSEEAVSFYEKAAEDSSFLLPSHALFSVGRLKEASGDYAGAQAAYQKMVDTYTDDQWTDLAQTRLITLKIDGKIN
ncbi:MAG: tetratricopeptide repeat protein [Treponema sp.]|nr:tetratricopeptide repeat protein [Treponema sp.]